MVFLCHESRRMSIRISGKKTRVNGRTCQKQKCQSTAYQTNGHSINIVIHDTFSFSPDAPADTILPQGIIFVLLRTPSIGSQQAIT